MLKKLTLPWQKYCGAVVFCRGNTVRHKMSIKTEDLWRTKPEDSSDVTDGSGTKSNEQQLPFLLVPLKKMTNDRCEEAVKLMKQFLWFTKIVVHSLKLRIAVLRSSCLVVSIYILLAHPFRVETWKRFAHHHARVLCGVFLTFWTAGTSFLRMNTAVPLAIKWCEF